MLEVGWVPDTSLSPEADGESLLHYDAELRFWTTFDYFGFVLAAKIFGDKKGRWPDGHMIQTSPLQTPSAAKEGRVIADSELPLSSGRSQASSDGAYGGKRAGKTW